MIEKKEVAIIKQLIEESFKIELKKHPELNLNSSEFLKNQIDELLSKYNESYYGPFTVICQSSGFGKTKACESLKKKFYVAYCCLRDKSSTGYPYRSLLADFILTPNDEDIVIKNCTCYFNVFIDLLNGPEKNTKFEDFYEKYQQDRNETLVDLMYEKMNISKADYVLSKYEGSVPLLFVFDEASYLSEKNPTRRSNYYIIRRLLNNFQTDRKNIFALFLDTFSSLSKFMPRRSDDPSGRLVEDGLLLLEPIYLLPNWDVFVDYKSIKNMNDTIDLEKICMFGRVLWGSWMQTKKEKNMHVSSEEIFKLAITKLIGGKSYISAKLNINDCLAILSTRLGAIKLKYESTGQDLVAKNMAVCTFVNLEESIFQIDYPSEPMLAIAGAYFMSQAKYKIRILKSLIDCVESAMISQGEKGETIVKLILIEAMDQIKSDSTKMSKQHLKTAKVAEFIQQVFGKCEFNCGNSDNKWVCQNEYKIEQPCCIKMINMQLTNSFKLLNGSINFNHFTRPNVWLDETSLLTAIKRCAAVHCRANQKALDIVIPVCLNEENFEEMSAIMVQVKLVKEPTKPDFITAFNGICPTMFKDLNVNSPYLLLFFQLGSNEPQILNLKCDFQRGFEFPKRSIIYCEGISTDVFPNLSDEYVETLNCLKISSENLFESKEKNSIYEIIRFPLRKENNFKK